MDQVTLSRLLKTVPLLQLTNTVLRLQCRKKDLVDWAKRGGGCFAEDTAITMADGTIKKIQDLKPGDLVWNPLVNGPSKIHKGVKGSEKHPIFTFKVGESTIKVTRTHPMLTQRGVLKAMEVSKDDLLMTSTGEFKKITLIDTYNTDKDVYNLHLVSMSGEDVEGGIVAEGIITGDLDMQNKLKKGIQEYSVSQ